MTRLFLLCCLCLSANAYAQMDGDNLFDDSFLHEIHFSSIDTNIYINTKDYQMGSVEIDGAAVTDIGFKRKGNTSGYFETNKFPIKIKTNKYVQGQEYDGIKEFMLHMNYQDPTMLREKLTYEICDEMGLYTQRTAFAKVYIDDIYWGLYTIVEGKDEMYKQQFDNRQADALESTDFGGMCYAGGAIDDYYFEDFDVYHYQQDNGDFNSAWNRFIPMLELANNTPSANYINVVSQEFNIEDFFTYQALNVYLLNFDSYIGFSGNQRYVYDENAALWQVTPWDFNASFGLWNTNNHTVTDYPLFPGFGCIGNKMEEVPALKNYYLDAMCKMANTVCDTTKMYARIDELKAQIQEAVETDYRKSVSNQDFNQGTDFGYFPLFFEDQPALKTVLRERYKLISTALDNEGYDCSAVAVNDLNASEAALSLYPNPAQNELHIKTELPLTTESSIKVVNAIGQDMRIATLDDHTLNITQLDNGIYFCIIQINGETIVRKFIKQ